MARPPAYFDSSVLVKRYLEEEGAAQARGLMRNHRVVSSGIAPVEAMSGFRRRRVVGDISDQQFADLLTKIRRDRGYWELVDVDVKVIQRAEELILASSVRTLDALHLASALVFQSASGHRVQFVTSDARQREAARLALLDVVWVGS